MRGFRRGAMLACLLALIACAQQRSRPIEQADRSGHSTPSRSAPPSGDRGSTDMASSAVDAAVLPVFPLPAPRPSARYAFDRALFPPNTTLGEINGRIRRALARGHYADQSYFAAPAGFAVVAQLERIRNDGAPWPEPNRWKSAPTSLGDGSFSLSGFLAALRNSDPGRYRVIVFLVTTRTVTTTGSAPSMDTAMEWLDDGGTRLPPAIAAGRFTPDHDVTALVYEFERASVGSAPRMALGGGLTGLAHLTRAGLLPL